MMAISILFVESAPCAREEFITVYSTMGYDVQAVGTVDQALEILAAATVNVVIFRLNFDDVYGRAFTITAKRLQPYLKIIIASDHSPPSALPANVDAFVQKALSLEAVDTTIRSALFPPLKARLITW
jgi:DNA-binding NtrC family response regulator